MNRLSLMCLLLMPLLLLGCGTTTAVPVGQTEAPKGNTSAAQATGAAPVKVEIIYLNHLPMRSVLADINTLLGQYGENVSVTQYDFDTPEGRDFADAKQLTGHTPIAIFVNGSMEAEVDGHAVTFSNFPGIGWTMEDLRVVLDRATGKTS